MNNENNNDIIFDTNSTPLDNSTVDYNKLYNVETQQQPAQQAQIQPQPMTQQINPQVQVQPQPVQQTEQQINPQMQQLQNLNNLEPNINQAIEDEVISPVVTPLEQDNVNEDAEPEKKKSFVFVIIIALILIISIMFLFPIIFKRSF